MHEDSQITPIGKINWRNKNKRFGIKDRDRLGHIYVIGKTGVGKSTLLLNMAISDINNGNGLAVIDPHGDVAETLLNYIPQNRIDDVIYFNPGEISHSIAFNPLKGIHPDHHHLVASGLISTFKKIWSESWGPRLEYILTMSILSLLNYPHATLLDIQPLLTDSEFRDRVLSYTSNPHILSFWKNEFDKYNPAFRAEAITPILNKTGIFLTSVPLRNCVGQKTRSFRMQQVMDGSKILIANLSKGKIGEQASSIFGSMLVSSFQLAALHRSRLPEHQRIPFYLYVDEMHSFVSLSFADILAEARKYGLSLFLSHQYINQLDEKIRSAIFGNVGTMVAFRFGAEDAETLAKEFYPIFSEQDLIRLPKYSMYLKLMIDGATSVPFSADSLQLPAYTQSFKKEIIIASQKKYTKLKEEIERDIFSRVEMSRLKLQNQDSLF